MSKLNDINFDKYLDKMINRIFKILPLLEQNDENVDKYVDSLLIELNGGIRYFENNADYISVIFSLQGVAGTKDYNVWRSKIFECIGSVNKIKKEVK